MKNSKIPTQDLKELSAYLDGRLSRRQTSRFETRLNQEPDLKAAYTKLKRTRNLLRAAPRLRSPRNFTLTPEMIDQPAAVSPRFKPAYGLMSAVASLLLILVVSGDLLSSRRLMSESLADQAAPSIALVQENEVELEMKAMEVPTAADVETTEEGEASIQDEMPVAGLALEERAIEAEALNLDGSAPEAPTENLEAATGVEAEEPMAEEEVPLLMEAPPKEDVSINTKEAEVEPESTLHEESQEIQVKRNGTDASSDIPIGRSFDETISITPDSGHETEWSGKITHWPPIRWVEIGLALAAVTAGILAWIQRRWF